MPKLSKWFISAGIFFYSGAALGVDLRDGSRFAAAEFSRQMARCIMFYGIMGEGKDHRGNDQPIFKKYRDLSQRMALWLLSEVPKVGIKEETVQSWLKLYSKEMGSDMNYDAINVSIIMDKHGNFCKSMTENPKLAWEKIKNSPKYR